ncbi:putative PHAX RNA-binding domain protein [Trypoxylus dichotomus]
MEQDNVSEEGEIFDNDSDNYTPLERPTNYASIQPNLKFPANFESESESSKQSTSDSGSDSDREARKKRPKLKAKLRRPSKSLRQNKYNIWSTHIQEDVLADTLNTCDVTLKDRSRNVETYDYNLSRKSNKRTMSDRNNSKIRLVHSSKSEKDGVKGSSRTLLALNTSVENTEEEIARDLANKLCEEKEELIYKIVKVAGKEKVIEVFHEVKRIEKEGGMLVMNQSRRRTPGGVFLFLIKHDSNLSAEQHSLIFEDEKQKYKDELKKKKKKKIDKMKQRIAASRKNLPELLTRAEECVQKLVADNDRTLKKSEHIDVINPPPTPETDCHENSGDGIDQPNDVTIPLNARRNQDYNDDFLDLGSVNDMDLF